MADQRQVYQIPDAVEVHERMNRILKRYGITDEFQRAQCSLELSGLLCECVLRVDRSRRRGRDIVEDL